MIRPGISRRNLPVGGMGRMRKLRVGRLGRRPCRVSATWLAAACAPVLLTVQEARAGCAPQAASNITATCTGTTTNQGGGAPGTSAGTDGFGTGAETGITINVTAGAGNTVSGTNSGISVGDGVVTNNAGASITGGFSAVFSNTGAATVNNSGTVSAGTFGILAHTDATVTNDTGAGIAGGQYGIFTSTGKAGVINSGAILGSAADGIFAFANATLTNNTGASITGGVDGILIQNGSANVINSGSITGVSLYGVFGAGAATVTNNAGATIAGGDSGASFGSVQLTNSGLIKGTLNSGILAVTGATVTNNASASITGAQNGILVSLGAASANVTNSGTISGTGNDGIQAGNNVTAINNAGASITGGNSGIHALNGAAQVTNSGTISGSAWVGISAGTDATVTNNAGATIAGGQYGIFATAGNANVINSGSIAGGGSYGIDAFVNATVTNNTGASIIGRGYGILAQTGIANVINSGLIKGTFNYGIVAATGATVTNNASGSITGAQVGIVTTGAANVTNSGTITGTGNVGIQAGNNVTAINNAGASITGGNYGISAAGGGSSVFNAGTIAGGIAAIRLAGSGNTLTLAPGSVISGNVLGTGSDTFQLGGSGTATFDVSQIGPAAQYRGFGTFNKIDSSAWTLTGTGTFAGPVNVNGGTLSVNGDISSASSLTVNAGGTLGGIGIVGNTTINGGTLSPGNPVGTLTVLGNLVFTTASSYLVEISGAGADRVSVTGTATLGGATVNAVLSGTISKRYRMLDAAGGISGTFNPAVSTSVPNLTPSLSYDANDAYLNVALNFGGGLNANQRAVASTLTNYFNSIGSIPVSLAGLSPDGLTQASGETATGSQQTTFNAMGMFLGLLTDAFSTGRETGVSGPPAYAQEDSASAYASTGRTRSRSEREAYGMITKAAPRGPALESRWTVWAAGFGGSQTTDGNTALGSNTTTSRIAGVATGADYWFSPRTMAGFALAGGGTNFSVVNGGTGRSDLFQAGAFVRHTEGAAYVTAAAAYGWQDITTDRTVTAAGIDRLRAEFNANAWSGRVEGGYRYVSPWIGGIGITPYAAANATTFDLPGYAENVVSGTGDFARAYAARSATDTRSELGVRTDKSYALNDAMFSLRGRLAWGHDFNPERSIAATFQALPGASFVVNGAMQARDSALTTASADVKWMNGWSAAATFETEFSQVTRSYAGKGVVHYAW